ACDCRSSGCNCRFPGCDCRSSGCNCRFPGCDCRSSACDCRSPGCNCRSPPGQLSAQFFSTARRCRSTSVTFLNLRTLFMQPHDPGPKIRAAWLVFWVLAFLASLLPTIAFAWANVPDVIDPLRYPWGLTPAELLFFRWFSELAPWI